MTRLYFDRKGKVFTLTDQQALDRLQAGQYLVPVQPNQLTTPKEPTMPATTTAKRVVIDHSTHDHPSTSKARAACRAALAKAAEQAAAARPKTTRKPAAKKATAAA